MIRLQVADLVVVAARVLVQDVETVLRSLDVAAAEAALEAVAEPSDDQDLAGPAAALLHVLVRRPPLAQGGTQVALMTAVQFLAVNGYTVDLDPPGATARVLADLAAGRWETADLASWLRPRLTPRHESIGAAGCEKQSPWPSWMPSLRRSDPFDRFTERARTVLVHAQDEARAFRHTYVGTEHLLLGLIDESDGVAAKALEMLGVGGATVRAVLEGTVGRGHHTAAGHRSMSPRAKRVLTVCAPREARRLGHGYIGTEHLLLGLLLEGEGLAARILVELGADHDALRKQVVQLLLGHAGAEIPSRVHRLNEQIGRVRQAKQDAIDAGDLEFAATLRDTEKRLLFDKQRLLDTPQHVDVRHLQAEIARLRALLLQHGIDPQQTPPKAANS